MTSQHLNIKILRQDTTWTVAPLGREPTVRILRPRPGHRKGGRALYDMRLRVPFSAASAGFDAGSDEAQKSRRD